MRVLKTALFLAVIFSVGVMIGRFAFDSDAVPESENRDGVKPAMQRESMAEPIAPVAAPHPSRSAAPAGADSSELIGTFLRTVWGAQTGEGSTFVVWGEEANPFDPLLDDVADEELMKLVTSSSSFSEEDLEGVSDVRAFVSRLLDLALEEEPEVEEKRNRENLIYPFEVEFNDGRDLNADNSVEFPQNSFSPGPGRIYAVFPTSTYDREHIVARWRRVDDSKLYLLDRYEIHPLGEFNYVWFEPSNGWEPGEYQVSIFADDEDIEPLAMGYYEVDSFPAAPEP